MIAGPDSATARGHAGRPRIPRGTDDDCGVRSGVDARLAAAPVDGPANDALVALRRNVRPATTGDYHPLGTCIARQANRPGRLERSPADRPLNEIYSARDAADFILTHIRQLIPAPDRHRTRSDQRSRQSSPMERSHACRRTFYVGSSDGLSRTVEAVAGLAGRRERGLNRPRLCRSPHAAFEIGAKNSENASRGRPTLKSQPPAAASFQRWLRHVQPPRTRWSTRPGPASTKCSRAGPRRSRSRAATG